MREQHAPVFGVLLRRLRTRAGLTQEELAQKATLSARAVSDLERGINHTARKATAELLAEALGLADLERTSFVATARGRPPAISVDTAALRNDLTRTVTPTGTLIGRDSELRALVKLMAGVAAQRGNSVLVEGEPGIGKSSLVRAALAAAPCSGCEIFWGSGDELGQAIPLQPLLEGLRVREPAADPRRTTILRLLRGEHGADRGLDVSAALAEQLLALVADQCAVAPMILIIDDLQWADRASIAVWGRLARSVRRMPLLLVGMMRPVPQRDDLLALRRAVAESACLQLHGLAEAAVAKLVAALAGGEPDQKLLRLASEAAGNPLYVIELVAALTRGSGLDVTTFGAAHLTSGSAPGSLAAAIADRLGFVTRPTRVVLRAAALLGVDFAVPDLAIIASRGVPDLVPAIDEATAAGVLAESGPGLRFRHPLIRAALYDEMPVPVRAAWHRDAGRALARAGAPADRVARQLLQAVNDSTDQMEEWVLTWLADTADLLASQAPQVAAALLRQAVASPLADSARRVFLMARLADALYRVGDAAEAEQVASRALAHAADPDLFVDLHWTLAQCRLRAGRSAESLATLEKALASRVISARHRARLLTLAARTHCKDGEMDKAGRVAATALVMASEAGDNWAMAWALHVLTIVTGAHGQMTDALPLFGQALDAAQGNPALTDLRMLLQVNKAVTLGNLDRYEEAIGAARQTLHLADQAGMVIRRVQAHSALGELLFDTGRWAEAMAEVEALPDDLKDAMAACCDLGIAAVISFHRGEIATARHKLADAAPYARRIGAQVIGPLILARSLEREHAGAPSEALAQLKAGFAGNAQELDEIEDLLADAVRLATQTGDLATAQSLASHAAALADGSEIPHRQANALYCRSLLEHDTAGLLTAADRYGDADRPLPAAKALEAAAADLLRTGNRDQARTAFFRAEEIYTRLGAATDVARVRAGMNA